MESWLVGGGANIVAGLLFVALALGGPPGFGPVRLRRQLRWLTGMGGAVSIVSGLWVLAS
jgi:hypothetical protein